MLHSMALDRAAAEPAMSVAVAISSAMAQRAVNPLALLQKPATLLSDAKDSRIESSLLKHGAHAQTGHEQVILGRIQGRVDDVLYAGYNL